MPRLARKIWDRLPVDGAGFIPSGPTRAMQKLAAREFWRRVSPWYRFPAKVVARVLWLLACPVMAAAECRKSYGKRADFFPGLWDGWMRGKRPQSTVLQMALARGRRSHALPVCDFPGNRQSILMLAALGNQDDARLAGDKLESMRALALLGFRVPTIHGVVPRGKVPRMDEPPWTNTEKSGEALDFDVTGSGQISPIHEAHVESLILVSEKNSKFAKKFAAKMEKESWDIGRIMDTSRAEYLAAIWQSSATSGSVNASTTVMRSGNTAYAETSGKVQSQTQTVTKPVYGQSQEVAILTDRFLYLAKERGKPAHLIVNSVAAIRVNGSKLIVMDSDQKAHEMEIQKQVLVPETEVNAQSAASVDSTAGPNTAKAMTNDDVFALKNAGFGDEFLIARIKASPARYDVGTPDLVRLKQAGLSDAVIGAMMQASGALK
jgi:hypothetical protein